MKKITASFCILFFIVNHLSAQEYFTIKQYDVKVHVNKDASLDVDEAINVHFNEPRHGIFRMIPYKYKLESLPAGTEKANRQLESGGYANTMIENIKVDGWNYKVSKEGDYQQIKIGSASSMVDGDQQYVIHYRILNAINFFSDHSELYFNIIGDKWPVRIDAVHFTISLYDTLSNTPEYFVATGPTGSKENNTISKWADSKTFTGNTTTALAANEGVTVGIVLPKDFLIQQDYSKLGINWMALPVVAFLSMFLIWKRWGKDEKPTIQTEFYPPENVSPGISGYIIDDILNRRDLTALIPYWGAGGYLQVKETESKSLFGLVKNKEYTFIKLKDLPVNAENFEKTLFNGIFKTGNEVQLSDLKNVLYTSMNTASAQLKAEINRQKFYLQGSSTMGCLFAIPGIACLIYGGGILIGKWNGYTWTAIAFLLSGAVILFFSIFMRKKSEKGTLLLQKLLGFREFLKAVEKDRLKEFLKQDEHYFDKVLPYAIVFGIADTWKDKLEGLDIPPPTWYSGSYNTFNTGMFMSSLNHSMNQMSDTFYSAPSSSGSSGGSFGGGGSSGGGFGGGGGGSW